ncbi:uncharacterized protein LOC128346089 [Hemicordylus capensis]|uniref:uncharacterized protein LOC128346089 n=1 Tax=Hemicordylus capensis TaxID=884348 RepID=UPI002303DDEB|nr:uncharacterized protein LOC128346089 [Hemicordylus capensis]
MPRKAKEKKGGWPIQQPKRPAPPPSSSDEEDEEMSLIHGLISRMEALEKARAMPSDKGDGPSGGGGVPPPKVPRRTRGSVKSQLLTSLSSRLEALEKGGTPAGPVPPLEPEVPATPSRQAPGQPTPALPLPLPGDRVSALPLPSPSQPATPMDQPPADPSLPMAPGKQVQRVSPRGRVAPGSYACLSVAAWQVEAQQAIAASLAPSTRASYTTKLEAFSLFRRAAGLDEVWPVPVGHLQQFLVTLHRAGCAVSTLGGYLAALAFEAQTKGVADYSSDPCMRRMLEGWARGDTGSGDSRRPFTLDMVAAVLGHLAECCADPWEVSLFQAAVSVAFFSAFRPGELLPHSRGSPRDRCLQFANLSICEGEAQLFLRRSKTDQQGKGQLVRLAAAMDPFLCPVAAVRHYVGLGPASGGCLFVHADQSPLTQYQFLAVIKKALGAARIPLMGLTLHSFRIGAATTATRMSLQEAEVRKIGRWKSVAVRRYVR